MSEKAVRKVYPEEFKREAVRLAIERGNVSQVARDLGINDNRSAGSSGWRRHRRRKSLFRDKAMLAMKKWKF